MKLKPYLLLLAAAPFFTACGGGEESDDSEGTDSTATAETGPTFEEECTVDNDIFFQVEGYGYQFDSTFTYNGKIAANRTEWTVKNDSTASLNIYNYDLGAADSATNFQILVEFHSKNGEKLQPGVYGYNDYDSNLWAKVNIISPLGTVWFNWVSGMPDQGHVELNYHNEDNACGEFSLEVNKPGKTNIGKVILKGPWKTL